MWLSHRLEEEFPGIVMPALPVKMVVGKFDQTFVEVKRGVFASDYGTKLVCDLVVSVPACCVWKKGSRVVEDILARETEDIEC